MIGSTPLSGFPISDFHGEANFITFDSSGGSLAGGTSLPLGFTRVVDSAGGALLGGAAVWGTGWPTAGGFQVYGDMIYGDMPYILRQFTSTGGAVAGCDTVEYNRSRKDTADGGVIAGGAVLYIRVWCREGEGGMLAGGWGDEDGDFSKIVTCTFELKWPEVLFVPPSERWDIARILRSFE